MITNALASVAVNDIEAAVQWYQKVLGRPADATPMPELAEWKFPGGGSLQVYALPERAGACSCTLSVSSIDTEAARLEKLGVFMGNQMGEQVKVFMVKDPDGNSIAFAQALNIDGSKPTASNSIIEPWDWGDAWGFVPAVASTGVTRVVHCAGQCDQSSEDGHPFHPGDMAAQISGAIDNLEAVLVASELALSDVVRLNYYVTDIDAFNSVPQAAHIGRLKAAGCRPASTLLGVTALAMPGMMVEIEATAVS